MGGTIKPPWWVAINKAADTEQGTNKVLNKMSKSTNLTLSELVSKNISHSDFKKVQKPNKISRSLQTSLSLSNSQTVDSAELALNPQTKNRNTLTTTSSLHRVIFDNIIISTIKTSVGIKRYIYKYTDNQIHIKYTWWNMWNTKGGICVEVKSEEQKQLLISKANIIFPDCIAKTPSSPFESLLIIKNFNSLISTEDIKEDFKRTYQTSCKVWRFHSNSNKKPIPISSIKTNNTLTQTLLEKGVHIFDKNIFVKPTNNVLPIASTVKGLATGPITVY